MEYLIKHSTSSKGKKQVILNSNGDSPLTVSEKLSSLSGKEVICNELGETIYLVDTFQKKGNYQSTIYDGKSQEILTVYLSSTYQGLNLYVSSSDNAYAANHKIDMSSIHIYKNSEIIATIQLKKSLFGNSYLLDIKPQRNDEFVHLLAFVITKLLEYKADDLQSSAYAY